MHDNDKFPGLPKNRPIPQRVESENGSTVMKWRLTIAPRSNVNQSRRVAAGLSNPIISLDLDQGEDDGVVMSVTSDREVPYETVWGFSMRSLLTIEKDGVELVAIEGTPRDDWRYEFVAAEHSGAFDGDKTPLMISAEMGDLDRLESILSSDAAIDIDKCTPFGLSALGYAALRGHLEAVRLLINAGAQSCNGGEITTLEASLDGGVAVTRLLLVGGADVNARNRYGATALMLAAARGELEIVKELLLQGSDADIRDNAGRTAFDHAVRMKRTNVVDYLEHPQS